MVSEVVPLDVESLELGHRIHTHESVLEFQSHSLLEVSAVALKDNNGSTSGFEVAYKKGRWKRRRRKREKDRDKSHLLPKLRTICVRKSPNAYATDADSQEYLHPEFPDTDALQIDMMLRIMGEKGREADVVSFTIVINGLCRTGRFDNAVEIWDMMIRKGHTPDNKTGFNLCESGKVDMAYELTFKITCNHFYRWCGSFCRHSYADMNFEFATDNH
nr:pentatricopeptide repeat-containing protein At1g13040, mitochondrial [Ipomoea batatas]